MALANLPSNGSSFEQEGEIQDFLELIENGKEEEFKFMIDCFPDRVNYDFGDYDIVTPLHFAVKNNQLNICRILVERGCNVNKQSKEEFTSPLHLAADTNISTEIMQLLINAGANIEAKDNINCTALNLLFMEPGQPESEFQFEKFMLLLTAGASVKTSAAYGSQPLHGSVSIHHAKELEEVHDEALIPLCVQVTKLLLENGANANCTEASLKTPLHFATSSCCPSVMQLLLQYGAKVESRNTNGVTPLDNIARHTTPPIGGGYVNMERFIINRIKCLDLLLSHDADVNNGNHMGETALHWLVSRPSATTVRMLQAFLERGADPNAQTTRLQAPLHYICIACKEKADKNEATEYVLGELIDMLKSYGAYIELRDINGYTPLMLSIIRSDSILAAMLVKKGAQKNSVDKFGRTLYHALEIRDVNESTKSLFVGDVEYRNLQDVFGAKPCDCKRAEKAHYEEEGHEASLVHSARGIYDDVLENILGSVDEMHLMDEDELLTGKLFLYSLMSEAQTKENLDMSNHIRQLKDKIKNIDEFCKEKLSAIGIGKVVITKEFAIIQREVDTLINRIANAVREIDERMEFTPLLSGSMSEGTKIGNLDEFDYLLYMNTVSNMCDISDSSVPGFVCISAKDLPGEKTNGIFRKSDHALIANIFRAYLYQLIQQVLGKPDIWKSLHFYWEAGPIFSLLGPENTSNLVVQWAGIENNGLKISIDLAPVIHQKFWMPRNVREKSLLLRVPVRAFGTLIVISKEAPEHETFEGGNDKYLRLSYSHIEKEIMLSLPESKRKAYILAKVLLSEKVMQLLRPMESKIAPYSKLHISSYVLKMALFSMLENAEAFEDQDLCQDLSFSMKNIRKLVSSMFHYVENCIKHKKLPSYFLPEQNILRYHSRISANDRIVCNILGGLLE